MSANSGGWVAELEMSKMKVWPGMPRSVTTSFRRSFNTSTPLGQRGVGLLIAGQPGIGMVPSKVLVFVSIASTPLLLRSARYITRRTQSKDRMSKLGGFAAVQLGIGMVVTLCKPDSGVGTLDVVCARTLDEYGKCGDA